MPYRFRVPIFGIALAIGLVLLTSEAYRLGDLFDEVTQGPREWLEAVERNTPPPMLFRRAGDEIKYPRTSFGFVLGGEYGFRVDSQSGVVRKWLGPRDTSIALRLTSSELDTIYRAALDIRLFDDLRLDPATKDDARYVPSGPVHLVVRAGATQRELQWDGSFEGREKWRDDEKRLNAWLRLVDRIVSAHPEYQALPPSPPTY